MGDLAISLWHEPSPIASRRVRGWAEYATSVLIIIILAHDRRAMHHLNVTIHPTAARTAQQGSDFRDGPVVLRLFLEELGWTSGDS